MCVFIYIYIYVHRMSLFLYIYIYIHLVHISIVYLSTFSWGVDSAQKTGRGVRLAWISFGAPRYTRHLVSARLLQTLASGLGARH